MTAYTPEELSEFDLLLTMTESQNQLTRIEGRGRLKKFIEKHSKEKCDVMFAKLTEPTKKKRR